MTRLRSTSYSTSELITPHPMSYALLPRPPARRPPAQRNTESAPSLEGDARGRAPRTRAKVIAPGHGVRSRSARCGILNLGWRLMNWRQTNRPPLRSVPAAESVSAAAICDATSGPVTTARKLKSLNEKLNTAVEATARPPSAARGAFAWACGPRTRCRPRPARGPGAGAATAGSARAQICRVQEFVNAGVFVIIIIRRRGRRFAIGFTGRLCALDPSRGGSV